ncbi:MAG: type I restriction endonuclease subunit R [Paludibacteraceae bacterium]|nr:type I restriction endonuclease subunit R [Paludibacteraceae bacterium]
MTLSFKENNISQIPALKMLRKLGYKYLSPDEVMRLRGNSTSNVLLEPILRDQLKKINTVQVSSYRTTMFSEQNIIAGIDALKNLPMSEGYISASQAVYDLLTAGKTLEQIVDGDKKSYVMQYIDWNNIENNVFHVTEEFAVSRTGMNDTYRPDIVLFINGIPLCVIECKRPDIKDSLNQAISQHLRNQKEDGIRSLYVYSALLLATNVNEVSYATTGTPKKFWNKWTEQFADKTAEELYRYKLAEKVNEKSNRIDISWNGYNRMSAEPSEEYGAPLIPSVQDAYLYDLCRPERLLNLMYKYTLYDDGIKKIARYQQYFAVEKVMERVRNIEGGRRKGGVIWHTQGSGKSLTMVLLAQAILLDKSIKNPRVILVTDRTDLDRQITTTFRKCQVHVENATTGSNLVKLLESKSSTVITTIINKFETAVRGLKSPLTDPNIFVLIDEGHRSQYGEMGIKMEKALQNACFIAMTGTPLMKKEKSTAAKFGGIIQPIYTVDQAVKDGAVVPLLYEGRMVPQMVHAESIDRYFDRICEWMTDAQRADMKKKFSRADQINQTEQRIYAIAWDISQHFQKNWQGSKFKAQLVAPRKRVAIMYKKFLDEINIVSSEVLITSPDTREGEDDAFGDTSNTEVAFWKRMMDEHGTPKKYEQNIINRFKNSEKPEIIIVVDKLLTGFDEPKNTVLYLDRKLKDHTLLQAIARVNRVCDDKEFGYIVDYYGVFSNLNDALEIYTDFDEEDLNGTYTNIADEVAKLAQRHSDVWEILKPVKNSNDLEAYGEILRLEDKRATFYERLTTYARTLKIALSSIEFHKTTPQEQIDRYKNDLAMFLKLRKTVQERFSDTIDYSQYEGQIQKLIDTHIESGDVEIITELINIFDKEKFAEEVEKIVGKVAKADTIASRTAKYINENIETDPAFFKKFSKMLEEAIEEYKLGRISEAEYLQRAENIMHQVLSHTDSEIPESLQNNNAGRAYFGLSLEVYKAVCKDDNKFNINKLALITATKIDEIIKKNIFTDGTLVVDWTTKSNLKSSMKLEIEDFLIDDIKRNYNVPLSFDDMDSIIDRSVDVAEKWFK